MTEPQPAPPPPRPPFQFTLRTLLLLFVVLGSSMAVFGAWGVVVFGLVLGMAFCTGHVTRVMWLTFPVVGLSCLIGMCLLWPDFDSVHPLRRPNCYMRVHEIARALQKYHQENGSFPPAYVADKNGKPLFSWRVLILPYLGRTDIYKAYDLAEAWDGPKNKKLSTTKVPAFICPDDPSADLAGTARTSYVAVVGPNAAWTGDKPRKLADFAGQDHNTIMLLEVAQAGISWAEPRDLLPDATDADGRGPQALGMSSNHGRNTDFFFTSDFGLRVNVAMADGTTRALWLGDRSAEDLRKMLEMGGCEVDETDFSGALYGPVRRLNWPNLAALAVWLLSVAALLTRAVRSRRAAERPG